MASFAKSALLEKRGITTMPRLKNPLSNVQVCVIFSSDCAKKAFLEERAAIQHVLCEPIHEPIQPPMTESCLAPPLLEPIDPSTKDLAHKLLNEMILDLNHHYRFMAQKKAEYQHKTLTKKVYAPERSLSIHGATAYGIPY